MLITKHVKIKMNSKWKKRYNDLNYFAEVGELMTVRIEDVPLKSGCRVEYVCDYCHKKSTARYAEYNRQTITEKDCCNDCKTIKMKDSLLLQYGVSNANKLQVFRDKIKKTNLKKYGVENPLQNSDIIKKIIATNLTKYGVENVMQHLPHFKTHQKAMANNNSQCSSKPQHKVATILKGYENYYYNQTYWLDVFFEKDNIYLEYDGGGHDLKVKFNLMTREDFNKKQNRRYYYLKENGLKMIRIISQKNFVPESSILESIKNYSFNYLKEENNNWIIFDVDESHIKTKQKTTDYNFSHTLNYN
jgi:very-short-patch-repair endonuclease